MRQVVGSIEIPGRTIHGDEPITSQLLRDVARSYDPELREAVVIAAPEGSGESGHFAGQYGPSLGAIRSVDFDGVFLWADFEPTETYRAKTEAGYRYPSIYVRRNDELAGSPWYLMHVALLSGEAPGTPNLGRFRSLDAAMSRGTKTEAWRSQVTLTEEQAVEPNETEKNEPAAAVPDDDKKTPPEPGKAEGEQPEGEQPTQPAEGARATDKDGVDAIMRAVKAGAADTGELIGMLRSLSAKVDEQGKALEKMRAEHAEERKRERTEGIRRSLNTLAGDGRLRAANVDKLAGELAGMSAEGSAEVLRALENSTPPPLGSEITIGEGDGATVVQLDDHRYRTAGGGTVSREVQAKIAQAKARSTVGGKYNHELFRAEMAKLKAQGVA